MIVEAKTRVVATGLGTISPLGNNVKGTWQNLIEGRSGIGRISTEGVNRERVGSVNSQVDIAGLVKDFKASDIIPPHSLKRIHRSAVFSTVACLQALKDAGFINIENLLGKEHPELINIEPEEIGARIGTGVGGGSEIAEMEDMIINRGDQRISPTSMLRLLSERVTTVPSILLGLKGPCASVVAACATGSVAIGDARDKILLGKAQAMLAGGVETAIDRIGVGGFNAMPALSRDNDKPESASRPFNKDVSGFVMAEGVGVLVLENLDHVKKRNAEDRIYAELIGYAETADAFHDTVPSGEGAVRAMRLALEDAGIRPDEVDYINAHGTSTPLGDEKELDALFRGFW